MKKISLLFPVFLLMVIVAYAQPTTEASNPNPRNSYQVFSIFSDAYTAINNVNTNPYWGQNTASSIIKVNQNNVLSYVGLTYQGTEFSPINVTDMATFHLDIFPTENKNLIITLVNTSVGKEQGKTVTGLTPNQWNSIEIPVSYFTNVPKTGINQMKIEVEGQNQSQNGATTTVYFDNIYFYNDALIDNQNPTNFTVNAGLATFNSIELLLSANDDLSNIYYSITEGGNVTKTVGESGKSHKYIFRDLIPNKEYTYSIVATDAAGKEVANNPVEIKISTTAMIAAATQPTVSAANVISVYSETYSNIGNFLTTWGSQTVSKEIAIDANNHFMELSNFSYEGIEFSSSQNVSDKTHIHIDMQIPASVTIYLSIISPGKEWGISVTPSEINKWQGFDIPLANFVAGNPAIDLTQILHLKLEDKNRQSKTIYFDNIYFYKSTTTGISSKEVENINVFAAEGILNVTCGSDLENGKIEVFNLTGQLITSKMISNTNEQLAIENGFYIVKISNKNKQQVTSLKVFAN